MPKRHYVLALACYLSMPPVLIAGGGLFRLIDPEMARSHADYVRDYRLLELARLGALMAAAGLVLVLWASTCYLSSSPCLRTGCLRPTICISNSSES